MNVLFVCRDDIYDTPGGDTIQIVKTKKFLEKLGVHISIHSFSQYEPEDFDLVHFFNIINCDKILGLISHLKIPYVLSTIYVDYTEYEKKARRGYLGIVSQIIPRNYLQYFKIILKSLMNKKLPHVEFLRRGYYSSMQYVAGKAHLLLPNSNSEMYRLKKDLNLDSKYHVIPNAYDDSLFNDTVIPDNKFSNSVVCVARIEGLKNQHMVIRAMESLPYKLFIIGKSSPNHKDYYEYCKTIASDRVEFIEHVEHEKLPMILKAARVHVLASWFETTGLVSLEAAAMGCAIVVSKKGDQCEYFKKYAHYCDPENVDSIKNAIEKAYQDGETLELKEVVCKEYTWKRTAEETLLAYEKVLN